MDISFSKIVRNNLGNYIDSFYLAIKHENKSYIDSYIEKFLKKTLTVVTIFYTKETSYTTHKESDGQHFHFVVIHKGDNEILNKKVTNSLMRHYVNKYNLAGNSVGTRVRQYGLIKKSIKSVSNLIRYVTKENQAVDLFTAAWFAGDDLPQEHHEEIQLVINSLPQWETNEDNNHLTFFNQTLDELMTQSSEIINNEYSIIRIILKQYDLANKHPPVKATIEKYLRILDYKKLSTTDFIDKYYLNNNYNATY